MLQVCLTNACVGIIAQDDTPRFQPRPHNHRYSTTINQNYVFGSEIFDANCIAPVSNATGNQSQEFVYGMTSSEYFMINRTNGVVTLSIDARDLPPGEGPFTTILYCNCINSDRTSRVELSVAYEIENEHVPRFTHGNGTLDVWITEDHVETVGSFITQLNITDDDLKPCNTVTFVIEAGNVDRTFSIGSRTGVLEVIGELDSDVRHKYDLTIRATNTECGQRRFSVQTTVCVYIQDIDDEHPTFEERIYTFLFDEGQQPVNFVQLRCSDVDTPGVHIVYEEDYLLPEYPFTINHFTGYVSATEYLDYEQQTSYHLTFICYDLLSPGITDTSVVKIFVNPVNEFLPDVTPTFAYVRLDYTSPVGTLLASTGNHSLIHLSVTDRDHGQEHGMAKFVFAESNAYYDYFDLDRDSGRLSLMRQLDFDVCGPDAGQVVAGGISLRIIVCDTLQDPIRLQLCPMVAIYIAIVAPSCTLTFLRENYTVSVSELSRIGSEVLEVHCEVPGRSKNSTSHLQTIEVFSPNSEFSNTLRIEQNRVILQEPLDYESCQQFTVYLRCSNPVGQENIASLLVYVLPENDSPPYFEKSLFSFRVTNEQLKYFPAVVGYISAKDEDEGITSNLTYTVVHNHDFHPVSNDSDYFTLTLTANGTVAIVMQEYPRQELSVLDIIVSDGINTAQSSILIIVTSQLKPALSSSIGTDQCGIICVVLMVIVIFMSLTAIILAIVVCICHVNMRRVRKGPVPLMSVMELQNKTQDIAEYSNLQRDIVQGQTDGMASHL